MEYKIQIRYQEYHKLNGVRLKVPITFKPEVGEFLKVDDKPRKILKIIHKFTKELKYDGTDIVLE